MVTASGREVQRRTVGVLAAGQVLGGLGVGSAIAVGGLIAEDVSGSTTLSGLAQTASVLGAAIAALPLARLMSARGRRPGLASGYAVAAAGAVLVVLGSVGTSFLLVLVGATMLGVGSATNLQARYAATDLAAPDHRARDLSTVVWATTVGVVLGPNLTGSGAAMADALGLPELSGPVLFGCVAFVLAVAMVVAGLRPDPLLEARRRLGVDPAAVTPHASFREAMAAVVRSTQASLGLAAVALGHAVMVSVMVMTPVHMRHEGATLRIVGLVISLHVAGMFALAPLVGWLSDRYGRVSLIMVGQVVLVASVAVAGTAGTSAHLFLGFGLFLLGLGWCCTLVAGSTLLSESVPEEVRTGVQGASDFVMGMCGAVAGALAGVVMGGAGYGVLNACAGLLVLPVVAMVLLTRPRQPTAVPD